LATARKLPVDNPFRDFFALNRSSTSFAYSHGRIHMRMASARKENLADQTPGDIVRALWHLGENNCSLTLVQQVVTLWKKDEIFRILKNAAWMPYWLLTLFREVSGAVWVRVAAEVIAERARDARDDGPPHQL